MLQPEIPKASRQPVDVMRLRWALMGTPSLPSAGDEVAFLIDFEQGSVSRVTPLEEVSLQSIGLKERADLQSWVTDHPEIVGQGLLLVTSEFDQWELREQKVPDRLDVLFLDRDGAPVVAELKRDKAADTTELQALKYAAYCSQLTLDEVIEEYARFHDVAPEGARADVLEHAPMLVEGELAPVRVRLVAGSFGPAVTSVVLWLRDHDIDIGCIQVTARRIGDEKAVLSAQQIIPLPEAEDYLVRRRRKEKQEESTNRHRRTETSVTLLAQAEVVKPGDLLTLKVDAFAANIRSRIQELLAAEPDAAKAEWTGSKVKALKWERDGQSYSPTGLVNAVRVAAGLEPAIVAGPDYWLLPNGVSMYEQSKLVEQELAGDVAFGNGAGVPSDSA